MDSILTSTKKFIGIEEDYTHFDPDILMNINSAMMSLMQLGVGPKTGFVVQDKNDTWPTLLGGRTDLEAVKQYIFMKVRLSFDPPQNSFLVTAMEKQIAELEWRLNVQAEGAVYV